MSIRHIVGILAGFCAVVSFAGTPPKLGKPIERPDAPTKVQTYGLLRSDPVAKIVEPGVVEILFETEHPSPPAVGYFGLNTLDEDLDFPRYRDSVREDGTTTELRTRHRIRYEFAKLVKRAPTTPIDARLTWRVEVYVPQKNASRFFQGRLNFAPGSLADTVTVSAGPFVDQISASSALISWETDRPSTGAVQVAGKVYHSDSETTVHSVRVSGLQPATEYEYRVVSGDTVLRPYRFRTAPTSGEFRFAAMIDCREGIGGGEINAYGVEARALNALLTHAYRAKVEFVLFGGDLSSGYVTKADELRRMLDSFRTVVQPVHARIPIYESMGNHESLLDIFDLDGKRLSVDKASPSSTEDLFAQLFWNPENGPKDEGPGSPPYLRNVYFFDYAGARFIVLNNDYWYCSNPHRYGGCLDGYVLPQQMNWLRERVAEASRNATLHSIFYLIHKPPFPNGGHTADAMWYKGGDTNRDGKVDDSDIPIIECRNTLWEIVASTPKSVALITGDEHAYCRLLITDSTPVGPKRKLDGETAVFRHPVWQITAGGAGAPWYDRETHLPWSREVRAHSTQPHYALFEVKPANVNLTVVSQTGQVIDRVPLRSGGKVTAKR